MKYERAKKIEVSHYEQLKLVEESLLWSLSMYKEQENGYKEAQERQDQELIINHSRALEDYKRLISSIENEFSTLMHNHPQLASEYAGKLKDRINTKSERDVFSESTKEIALDSIKNNSSDIELVTDIHLYKLLEKEKIRV